MTRDPEQVTADLRREVRRLVEAADHVQQLAAMHDAWSGAAPFDGDVIVLRPDTLDVCSCAVLADPCPVHPRAS